MHFPPVNVYLTGHRGYIGGAVLERLRGQPGVRVIASSVDLTDREALVNEFRGLSGQPWRIIHLATINRTRCLDFEAYAANMRMVDNLLSVSRTVDHVDFLFMSSSDVFGSNPEVPLRTNSPHCPDNWYSLSKSNAEWLVKRSGSRIAIARLPGVFGAAPREESLLKRLIVRGVREGKVALSNSGNTLRDFVYLPDLLSWITVWLVAPIAGEWNLAAGHSMNLREWLSLARSLLEHRFEILEDSRKTDRDFPLVFDTQSLDAAFPEAKFRTGEFSLPHYVAELRRSEIAPSR